MNKEQKSFGEYGAAWATTVVIHTYIRSLLKYRGTPLSPDALHTYRDKVLKEAWRWRRICRNITNKKLWNTKLKMEMIGLELLIKIIEKTK